MILTVIDLKLDNGLNTFSCKIFEELQVYLPQHVHFSGFVAKRFRKVVSTPFY